MRRHDPRKRDVVAFLSGFAILGMVVDLIMHDWPLVARWLSLNPWALASVFLVSLLGLAVVILATALRRRGP